MAMIIRVTTRETRVVAWIAKRTTVNTPLIARA
jgi:hypothetical protein